MDRLPGPADYIDIHTHADRVRAGLYVYSADPARGIPEGRHQRMSVGLHPWSLDTCDSAEVMTQVEAWAEHPRVVAIGECGLDRLISTPLPRQADVFLRHLTIAERVGKPLIVHCVRAHNELVRLLKTVRHGVPVIIHGFNNNRQIAADMLRHGILLSFGAPLLRPDAPLRDVLARCPEDRFFLETDDSDAGIEDVYAAAAHCCGTCVTEIQARVRRNYAAVFGRVGSDHQG